MRSCAHDPAKTKVGERLPYLLSALKAPRIARLAWSCFRVVVPVRDKRLPSVVIKLDRTLRVLAGVPTYGGQGTVKIAKADLVPTQHNLRDQYPDWQALERAFEQVMAEVNTRPHRATRQPPIGSSAQEHQHLHRRPRVPHTITTLPEQPRRSLTWDQGTEMAKMRKCEAADRLRVVGVLLRLRQPWQRGTNENTNGLLRQYFPKAPSPL